MPSASQEMPHISWNLERHYGIHNSQPPVHIPSHTNPVHAPPPHFLKNHFNIILPSMSCLPSGLFPSAPTISLLFGHLSNIWWAVKLALETKFHVYKSSHGQNIAISPLVVCAAFINSNFLPGVACPPRMVEVGPKQHLTLNV